VIEVHPPTEPVHGWRDFLVHLLTITIGLVIALSLEGCVEWRHHRQLVREAVSSLQGEIKANAEKTTGALEDIRKEQETLKNDVAVMKRIIANPKTPNHEEMTIAFRIRTFDDVSWRTAQSTGALGYMEYEQAHQYSNLYDEQNEIYVAEQQAVRDTVLAIGPFLNLKKDDANPSGEEAVRAKEHFEVLQGQLMYLENGVAGLDVEYKKFLAAHPQ
jgi:uncharacterized protein YjbK